MGSERENEKERARKRTRRGKRLSLCSQTFYLRLQLPGLLVYALGAARGHQLAAVVDLHDPVDDRDVCLFVCFGFEIFCFGGEFFCLGFEFPLRSDPKKGKKREKERN